jgi:hypothetical protein
MSIEPPAPITKGTLRVGPCSPSQRSLRGELSSHLEARGILALLDNPSEQLLANPVGWLILA